VNFIKNSNMTKSETLNMMKLLGIKEVTTPRQALNGTREFELPIKYPWGDKVRVASFKTGYVRNQNGCSSNYQLNKVKKTSVFHKYTNQHNGYYKVDHYKRVLIASEKDRLEYLLHYCIKNYYVGYANFVANGNYIPKWKYESYKDEYKNRVNEVNNPEVKVIVNGQKYNII
tara:strand:- start:659 stop:1174 length:516 start_codon:yes stop_codon:yes gene_type:complete